MTKQVRQAKNVLGGVLQPCSTSPMAGFYRDGCCRTGREDVGLHVVCAVMTEAFLSFSRRRGNDLVTPNPAFDFPGLNFVRTVEESKAINQIRGTSVIIAGSGMCTGGRIKHHLIANIGRAESTILFVGYQAQGTLGRRILRGDAPVRILGRDREVLARIEVLNGLSAHGDSDDMLEWLGALHAAPRRVFVVHGEERSSAAFSRAIDKRFGWPVSVPDFGETVSLT